MHLGQQFHIVGPTFSNNDADWDMLRYQTTSNQTYNWANTKFGARYPEEQRKRRPTTVDKNARSKKLA